MNCIINQDTLTKVSGPHVETAREVKIHLGTGNVSDLDPAYKLAKGVVPYVQDCTESQVYTGAEIITATAVTREVRDKTAAEVAEDLAVKRSSMRVTMRQARQAMLFMGLLTDIETALAAIVDPVEREAALIAWEYSQEVQRTFPWVQSLLPPMGFTDTQIDDLFIYAGTL